MGASLAVLVLSLAGHARAAGAWIPGGVFEPAEQRVAVSVGPDRTTVWTSLRFDAAAGKVGIVVPVPPGAALDFSSDAWFEALEVATAPRIFPPEGEKPYCPGKRGATSIFDTAAPLAHVQSAPIDDVAVLDDAGSVATWASAGGLDLSPAVATALGALGSTRFVAVRFVASGGLSVTRTLRIAMPGAPPLLPLALTRAGSKPLPVTTWILGEGGAQASGGVAVTIPPSELAWDARTQRSNYAAARAAALAAEGSDGVLVECAGAEPLATNVSIAGGTAAIDGLVTAYFDRAAAYGDGLVDPAACISTAAVALTSSSPVAASCPRADLGVIAPETPCVESTPPGGVDPAKLRCGGSADDLAVALSGLDPTAVWLTRQSMQIPAGNAGIDWTLLLGGGAVVSPVLTSQSLDLNGCSGSGATSSASGGVGQSSASASSSGASGTGGTIFFGDVGAATAAGAGGFSGGDPGEDGFIGSGEGDPLPVDTGCGCSSTADTSSSDGCDGSSDTSSGSCSGDSGGGDTCSGDSSSGDSCDGSSGGDSCDSSSGGDSCDGASGGDSCSSGGGDASCSGGSSDCAVAGGRASRHRAPRFSVLSLVFVGLLAPIRRRGTRVSRAARRRAPPVA